MTLGSALNSRPCAKDSIAPITASVGNNDTGSRERLRSCPEMYNYFLQKYATDQVKAEYDAEILRHTQTGKMTLHQHANNLVAA